MPEGAPPLEPLTGRKRVAATVVIAGYLVAAAVAFLAAAFDDPSFALGGLSFLLCAAGLAWQYRRRTDLARTAGWGVQAPAPTPAAAENADG